MPEGERTLSEMAILPVITTPPPTPPEDGARRLPAPPPGYDLIGQLGSGGSGSVVYEARQRSLDRIVAVKYLGHQAFADEDARQRFLTEGRALAALNHRNIVTVYDMAQAPAGTCLVMEYVPGPSLASLVAESGRLPLAYAVRVVLEIAGALGAAHSIGVLHRDVKPANVLIGPDAVAKLADFGIASGAGGASPGAGFIAGTPAYMAPEQAAGRKTTASADVYSLGIVAYELLAGTHPFAAVTGGVDAMLEAQRSVEPAPLRLVDPSLPAPVAAAVMAAISKSPRRRPRDAAAFARDLRSAADSALPGWEAERPPLDRITILAPAIFAAPDPPSGAEPPTTSDPPGTAEPAPPAPAPRAPSSPTVIRSTGAGTSAAGPSESGTSAAGTPASGTPAAGPSDTVIRPSTTRGSTIVEPVAPKRRGVSTRTWILLAAAVVVIAGAAIAIALSLGGNHQASSPPTTSSVPPTTARVPPTTAVRPAIRVASVRVTVAPSATGHCPAAVFDFTGTITTNGRGGIVSYRWTEPNGTVAPTSRTRVPNGASSIQTSLKFRYGGTASASGAARLTVLSPGHLASTPLRVSYRCP